MNILKIYSSARKQASLSRSLADDISDAIQQRIQASCVLQTRDLGEEALFIDEAWVTARGLPDADRTEADHTALTLSNTMIKELRAADVIVAGIPIYNFNIPASFKAWLDLVVRARETFRYTENGPIGLLENKQFIAVISSGGTELGSQNDFATPYLKFITQFIGIKQLTFINATGSKRQREEVLESAKSQIEQIAF